MTQPKHGWIVFGDLYEAVYHDVIEIWVDNKPMIELKLIPSSALAKKI